MPAVIRIKSELDDLAVLKADLTNGVSAYFRKDPSIQLGSNVIVFGYPLFGQLTREGNVSVGLIAALAGQNDDPSKFQISAPVQSGNSGGPVLDQGGNVIGVVVAKSDLMEWEEGNVEVLQNINFAIKSSLATDFLYKAGIPYLTQTSVSQRETTDIVEAARNFTVAVACMQ